MKKKYLTTPEEILALKDTNTKIYCKDITEWYCQFIGGVLCRIYTDKTTLFNTYIDVNENYYILLEEPVKEADENDIGKLCWFWDGNEDRKVSGVLTEIDIIHSYPFCCRVADYYKHCRRLTPAEVAEITGYKVEE